MSETLASEEIARILSDRARLMAAVPAETERAGQAIEVFVFELAAEFYAIETRYMHSVVALADPLVLPWIPDPFLGLTNLRGEILPVLDLGRFLGTVRSEPRPASWLAFIGRDHPELGIAIDRAVDVRPLAVEDILPPPRAYELDVAGGRRGVTRDAVIVLDGAALLEDPRLFVNEFEGAAVAWSAGAPAGG